MGNNKQLKTVPVPQKLFDSFIEAQRKWEDFNNELEDFLISLDTEFIRKIERARKEHLQGETRSLAELKEELG